MGTFWYVPESRFELTHDEDVARHYRIPRIRSHRPGGRPDWRMNAMDPDTGERSDVDQTERVRRTRFDRA